VGTVSGQGSTSPPCAPPPLGMSLAGSGVGVGVGVGVGPGPSPNTSLTRSVSESGIVDLLQQHARKAGGGVGDGARLGTEGDGDDPVRRVLSAHNLQSLSPENTAFVTAMRMWLEVSRSVMFALLHLSPVDSMGEEDPVYMAILKCALHLAQSSAVIMESVTLRIITHFPDRANRCVRVRVCVYGRRGSWGGIGGGGVARPLLGHWCWTAHAVVVCVDVRGWGRGLAHVMTACHEHLVGPRPNRLKLPADPPTTLSTFVVVCLCPGLSCFVHHPNPGPTACKP
jgi:hypothetical protein